MHEIERYHRTHETGKSVLFGITGCMVRKSGIAKRYLSSPSEKRELEGVTQKGIPNIVTHPNPPFSGRE
jgi:hypothetical protein